MATQNHSTLVAWREWGEDAFRDAREQDKPILLDIGAVWCHWCHVMDTGIADDPVHTGTYSRPDIAELINSRYIPIKVDNDRRPDINARYNMGGWPTTAFLTPAGDTLYGETYVPPDRMLGLLQHIADYYAGSKDEIAQRLSEHAAETQQEDGSSGDQDSALSDEIPATVTHALKSMFDFQFGGFGNQPKFPQSDALEFAVRRAIETGDDELRQIVEKTLDGMSGGGMYDRFAGGFFRYSTTRDWSIPHFEKMLEDNANLSRVCLLASEAFDEPRYAEIARDVHGWLFDVMHGGDPAHPSPTFAGSQDADGEEAYYGLPLEERANLPTPYIDRTVYLGWNALMVSSMAERYRQFGEEVILQAARETYDFLKESLWPRHYFADGQSQGESYLLGDVTAMLTAALDLCDTAALDQSQGYLQDALSFADVLLSHLLDSSQGGFYDMPVQPDALGALSQPKKEMPGTSAAVAALLKLYAYTGDTRLRQICGPALTPYAGRSEGSYRAYGLFAAQYALAVSDALAEPVHVVVVGDDAESARQLRQAAWKLGRGGRFIACEMRSAANGGEYPAVAEGQCAIAYLCIGTVCHAPVRSSDDLNSLWHRLQAAAQVR